MDFEGEIELWIWARFEDASIWNEYRQSHGVRDIVLGAQ